jgi:hypothetical protein
VVVGEYQGYGIVFQCGFHHFTWIDAGTINETVVKAFRPPDAIKYSHAKPQEISLERRID